MQETLNHKDQASMALFKGIGLFKIEEGKGSLKN
jgi:hypothetical protein